MASRRPCLIDDVGVAVGRPYRFLPPQLTKDDIKALVASLRDITVTLAAADPTDKAAVYEEMGIDVTYHQDGRVLVESRPRVIGDGVGGPIPVLTTRPAPLVRSYSVTA